ncbi:MAG TPA: hypothetical protein VGQ81_15220 [Acidobacteriota bacterium]|jgi:hypothetical protein|nr:hypothetical protein [Acidobacteriota bacterium]
MRRFIPNLICLCFCLITSVRAQSELQLFVGGYNPGSNVTGTDFKNGALMGFRLGHSFVRLFGSEFSYTYVKNLKDPLKNFEGRASLLNGNIVVQLPAGKAVPFATVGIGNIIGETQGLLRVKTSFAWNVGGGLKFRRLAGPVGLRFDVRYYKASDAVEILTTNVRKVNFDFAEASGGLLITF